jgi:energy-coupling factor transporter ATP-binding protein EcfA2
MSFNKATKFDSKLRMALIGPAGSGKTFTALSVATGLIKNTYGVQGDHDRIAVLDSEHGSASKYADMFEFDVMEPETFSPQVYIDAIQDAERAGYGVIILDSLSHAWAGKGGALEMVDAAARRAKGNKYMAWGEVTPLQQNMVDTILSANIHVIGTIRSKMEYTQDVDAEGRKIVRKLGMQPVQRDQLEYEFDLIGDLDNENTMTVTKSRIPALTGAVIRKPGKQLAESLLIWLSGVKRDQGPAHVLTAPKVAELKATPIPVIADASGLLQALQGAITSGDHGEWSDLHDVAASLKSLGIAGWPRRNDVIAWGELYDKLKWSRGAAAAGGEMETSNAAQSYQAA